MKKFIFIITAITISLQLTAQNITFDSIGTLIESNIEAGNYLKNYNVVKESKGFNFLLMIPNDSILYDGVFIKSYYNDNNLIKIEVIDTLNKGRNFDIVFIYESNEILIGLFYIWDNSDRNHGFIETDQVFINYKHKKISVMLTKIYTDYIEINKTIDKIKFHIKKPQFLYDIAYITILDERLYNKYDFYFSYEKYIYYSEYIYIYGVSEFQYIFNDCTYPKYDINEMTIDHLLFIINLQKDEFNYYERNINLNFDEIYWKNKPIWIP